MTHFVRKTLWALLAAGTVAVLSVAAIPAPFALAPDVPGGNVEGTIIVKKKLTKPRVTSSVDEYGRSAVELGADAPQDPLSYERSHVVVYLDGAGLPSRAVSASMEQKNRRFSPDLLVIPQGSTVSFPNLDSIFHNVFALETEILRPRQLPDEPNAPGDVSQSRRGVRELPLASQHGGGHRGDAESLVHARRRERTLQLARRTRRQVHNRGVAQERGILPSGNSSRRKG